MDVHGAAHFWYDAHQGQSGDVMIVADDVMAPDDADLRQVLATMRERLRDGDWAVEQRGSGEGLSFRSGRFDVKIVPHRGGASGALRAAERKLAAMHGTGVTPERA